MDGQGGGGGGGDPEGGSVHGNEDAGWRRPAAGTGKMRNTKAKRQAGRQNEGGNSGRNRTPEAGRGMELGDSGMAPGPLALFCVGSAPSGGRLASTQTSLARAAHLSTSQMSDMLNGKIKTASRLGGHDRGGPRLPGARRRQRQTSCRRTWATRQTGGAGTATLNTTLTPRARPRREETRRVAAGRGDRSVRPGGSPAGAARYSAARAAGAAGVRAAGA